MLVRERLLYPLIIKFFTDTRNFSEMPESKIQKLASFQSQLSDWKSFVNLEYLLKIRRHFAFKVLKFFIK